MKMPRLLRPQGQPGVERPNGKVALGLLLIGTGRVAGFAQFGGSTEAYLASLAPLLGLLIVIGGVIAWSGQPLKGLATVLTGVCALFAPPVIGDLFCRVWQRRQHWALYANVLNFSQWLMAASFLLLLPAASLSLAFGATANQAATAVIVLFGVYVLWFHWFAARHVLDLSRGRALVVMLAVVFGTGLLLQAPALLAGRPIGP